MRISDWSSDVCSSDLLIKKGIRINCSLPSPTQTPMMKTFHETSGKDIVDAAAEPLGRYTTPEEPAGPLVLINSDLAGVVNGIVMPVYGGFMGALAPGPVVIRKLMGGAKTLNERTSVVTGKG